MDQGPSDPSWIYGHVLDEDEDEDEEFELPLAVRIRFNVTFAGSLSHNLWSTWAELAVGHEQAARKTRNEGLATQDPEALAREFRSGVQAITQVAFALDGWFGATYPTLYEGKDRPPGAMNDGRLLESLRRAIGTGTLQAGSLADDVVWLFKDG